MDRIAPIRFYRQQPRIDLTLPVEYTISESLDFRFTKTETIGEGGLMLHLPMMITVGSKMQLKLHLPDHQTVICRVRVVWTELLTGIEEEDFKTGVAFEEITQADIEHLRHFIREQQNSYTPLKSRLEAFIYRRRKT